MGSSSTYHSPLPGTLYSAAREMLGLGGSNGSTSASGAPRPELDMDWNTSNPNDRCALRPRPFPVSSQLSYAGMEQGKAPPPKVLLDALVSDARKSQSRDIHRRRDCARRKRVEQQLRQIAKAEIEAERCVSPDGAPEE